MSCRHPVVAADYLQSQVGVWRHLISLTDDFGLLVSHNKVPAELRSLFAHQLDRIQLPANPAMHPHISFVRRHRERFAAG